MDTKTYISIDLKSFYASVECMERNRDPLDTNLVVADESRTQKTICLAVTPSLKAYGISGRARLFEVVQKVRQINQERRVYAPECGFTGSSVFASELKEHPEYSLSYLVAPPRMAHYMDYSTRIYRIYLKYVAPEDIQAYSIDEVFMDVTSYLKVSGLTAEEYARKIILDVLNTTGITATAGIGTNLYLSKIAMDIGAKHVPPDEDGVRIASLNERSYRETLWEHRPITDFWRVGRGYAKRLEKYGLYTMGDIAKCSIGKATDFYNEALLYKEFGVNAELLIDHAWGWEPVTLQDIKAYRPENSSICSGQVLHTPYTNEKALTVLKEMTDALALSMVKKGLVADCLVLTVGYDIENLSDLERRKNYHGEITIDGYGRSVPKHGHGTVSLGDYTSSGNRMIQKITELYRKITDENLLIRRISLTADHVISGRDIPQKNEFEQLNLFTDYEAREREKQAEKRALEKERSMQEAMIAIKKKYGKNAILKGTSFVEGATARERNSQIGGHKA